MLQYDLARLMIANRGFVAGVGPALAWHASRFIGVAKQGKRNVRLGR
jgi:hypothetical protein